MLSSAGIAGDRRAAGFRFQKQVVADCLQTALVGEAGKLDLAEILDDVVDGALGVDGDVERIVGDGNTRLHGVAVDGDELAVSIAFERAVAGIRGGAVRQVDLEEPFALDGDVDFFFLLFHGTLGHDAAGGGGTHTGTELDAGRHQGACIGGVRPDPTQVLVEQILELRTLALVAGGARVREVVRNDFDVEFLGLHARSCDMERPHWLISSKLVVGRALAFGVADMSRKDEKS